MSAYFYINNFLLIALRVRIIFVCMNICVTYIIKFYNFIVTTDFVFLKRSMQQCLSEWSLLDLVDPY